MAQYCCWRCNFGGMPVWIHGKMRYHASCRNGSMDVQQTNRSGKNISLFSSFRIHEAKLFSSVDEARHRAQERCRIVVSLRPRKLLLIRVKQQRLLILLLTTVKQRRLLMLLLTTVFLLKISPTFWECLEARFKSFLPIVYTDDAHTTTLMVTAKWFFWLHSINAWRVRREKKKKKTEKKRKRKVAIILVPHTKNEWLSRVFKIKQWMLRWGEKGKISGESRSINYQLNINTFVIISVRTI